MLTVETSPEAKAKFETYPKEARAKLDELRSLILEAASEADSVEELEETLKWGEPSYLTKGGSTVRIDWKPKSPDQVAIYFKCTSRLVSTFQEIYGDLFRYEKTRAILFGLEESVPTEELKDCIQMALEYHLLKAQPRLGR